MRLKKYCQEIGPHGIDNSNKYGIRLLGVLSTNNIKIVNTFYQKDSFTTWRSFEKTRSCHMLDVITSSFSFFKCIRDCGVTPKGVQSDQSAVQMVLLGRTINFKSDYVERPVTDSNKIEKILRLIDNLTFYYSINYKVYTTTLPSMRQY